MPKMNARMDLVLPAITFDSVKENKSFAWSSLPARVLQKLDYFRGKGIFTDVAFKANDSEELFHVHRVVVAACIPFFQTMFQTCMLEKVSDKVNIHEVDSKALSEILNMCYTGCGKITENNVQSMLAAADYMELNDIKKLCVEFLEENITAKNVLSICLWADLYNERALSDIAMKFLVLNFLEVASGAEFQNLSFPNLLHLVESDDIHVTIEAKVYEIIISWVKFDAKNRMQYLPQLLQEVRFLFMDIRYVVDVISNEPLIASNVECSVILKRATEVLLCPERARLLPPKFQIKRTCPESIGYIFACAQKGYVEIFSPHTRKWIKLPCRNEMANKVSCITLAGNKVATFGMVKEKFQVKLFDFSKLTWFNWTDVCEGKFKRMTPMQMVEHKGDLYLCGGFNGKKVTRETWKLPLKFFDWAQIGQNGELENLYKLRWEQVAAMKQPRNGAGVASVGAFLYVCGGTSGDAVLNAVERYSVEKNEWEYVAAMQTARYNMGVAVLGRKIYVTGGLDMNAHVMNTCEVYDCVKNEWSSVTSMLAQRCRHALVPIEGGIWAIGGANGFVNTRAVESYNCYTEKWQLEPLLEAVGCIWASVLRVKTLKDLNINEICEDDDRSEKSVNDATVQVDESALEI